MTQPGRNACYRAFLPLLLVSVSASGCGSDASVASSPVDWPPHIDPAAFGTGDLSSVSVAAFSQVNVDGRDPQVLDLKPDLVPRAWGQWDRSGTQASDYAFSYPADCQASGVKFIGGLTASVIFQDQMSDADFQDQVGRDASGAPVPHSEVVPNAYRAALASPGARQRLIDIAKLQIDGGVDGLFFDEVNSSYIGAQYQGNEGFDDHDVADFGRFLCAKRGADASALAAFDLAASDQLDCAADDPGASFDYRGYLARHNLSATPLYPQNPLSVEWGTTIPNRPAPQDGSFVQVYPTLVYWQQIVLAVRKYARDTYDKEILITANGIFPFVDFQSVGLYDYNPDAPGVRGFDYVPLTGVSSGGYDGTVSFMPVLQALVDHSRDINARVGGPEVPLLLFLDWPTDSINRYYGMTTSDRQDYLRVFLAESYAYGVWLALPLATTTDSNTATALGMLDFFKAERAFYQAHASLLRGKSVAALPSVSSQSVALRLTELADGRRVLHLVNHDYAQGFVPQSLTAQIPLSHTPTSVTLASPDLAADSAASFTYDGSVVTVNIDALTASLMIVVE